MVFENFFFKKHISVFELRHFLGQFRSISSSFSVNIFHKSFPVNYNLISKTMLASNICFSALLLLLLRDLTKYFRLLILVFFIGILFSFYL